MNSGLIDRAINICKEYGVSKLVLFGSAVDDLNTARDLDLAVEGIKGWEVIELAALLENELRMNVDVVEIKQDNKFINHVLSYGKILYS